MEHIPGKKPRDYIDELQACLSSNADLANKLRKKTRCVAVGYADGFSIDFVPCKVRGGRRYICNSELDQFEPTDGTGYQEWFNGKADITNGHLKGAVRLLKHLRDHKGNFEVPSVLLTTLAGHSVHVNERGKRFNNLPDTLKTVSNRINSFLQSTSKMPRIRKPALRSERFTHHWDENDYRNFKEKFKVYNGRINDAYEETDSGESLRKWRILFGERFQ